MDTTLTEQHASPDWAIDVTDLTKSFDKKIAVNGVSIRVKPGEIYGFLGPNGSGKTTFIRMLCGLLLPDSGSGQCLGYDIIKNSYDIKLQVGYMPQRFSLYEDLSIRENLDFIAHIYAIPQRTENVERTLLQLNLMDRCQQLVGTLSGGWKQRLALAGALLHQPKLLLLDEPTAGVDPKARRDFWDHIHALSDLGITILVSTHYMDEAARCHRLAYIVNGNILAKGTETEIVNSAGLNTWAVTGTRLLHLRNILEQKYPQLQTTLFGNELHVSSPDHEAVSQALKEFTTDEWSWQRTTATLEDIFINLVPQQEEFR